jgi:hypothetical protein
MASEKSAARAFFGPEMVNTARVHPVRELFSYRPSCAVSVWATDTRAW